MLRRIILIVISLFLALPVAASDAGSIVPVIWLFSQNEDPEWKEWNKEFKDISSIYQYDAYGNEVAYYSLFGSSSIYQYDAYRNEVAYYSLFGSSISQYDANRKKVAYFTFF